MSYSLADLKANEYPRLGLSHRGIRHGAPLRNQLALTV